jgi:hypothetical protein
MVVLVVLLAVWVLGRAAVSDPRAETLADAIIQWAPQTDPERAMRLAEIVETASRRHEIPSWIVAAMVMRESGYRRDVEELRLLGRRGERGLLQIHPSMAVQASRMVPGCSPRLLTAECQIDVGVAWLAHIRGRCPGPWQRWVAAYGMSRCPTLTEAHRHRSIRRIRNLLGEVGVEVEGS